MEEKIIQKKRTDPQNKAIHAWFTAIEKDCNERGITVPVLLDGLEVEVTKELVKKMFQRVAYITCNKSETHKLNVDEMNMVIKAFDLMLSKQGVNVPFNSKDLELLDEYYFKN